MSMSRKCVCVVIRVYVVNAHGCRFLNNTIVKDMQSYRLEQAFDNGKLPFIVGVCDVAFGSKGEIS